MTDLSRSGIIKKYPIGRGLDAFRETFGSTCAGLNLHESPDVVEHLRDEALTNLALDLFLALQNLPVARYLLSPNGRRILLSDLSRFVPPVLSNEFNAKSIVPILDRIDKKASDEAILNAVSDLVTESTPPLRQLPYPHQTPISFNTGSFVNTSENRKHFDDALRDELPSPTGDGLKRLPLGTFQGLTDSHFLQSTLSVEESHTMVKTVISWKVLDPMPWSDEARSSARNGTAANANAVTTTEAIISLNAPQGTLNNTRKTIPIPYSEF